MTQQKKAPIFSEWVKNKAKNKTLNSQLNSIFQLQFSFRVQVVHWSRHSSTLVWNQQTKTLLIFLKLKRLWMNQGKKHECLRLGKRSWKARNNFRIISNCASWKLMVVQATHSVRRFLWMMPMLKTTTSLLRQMKCCMNLTNFCWV